MVARCPAAVRGRNRDGAAGRPPGPVGAPRSGHSLAAPRNDHPGRHVFQLAVPRVPARAAAGAVHGHFVNTAPKRRRGVPLERPGRAVGAGRFRPRLGAEHSRIRNCSRRAGAGDRPARCVLLRGRAGFGASLAGAGISLQAVVFASAVFFGYVSLYSASAKQTGDGPEPPRPGSQPGAAPWSSSAPTT